MTSREAIYSKLFELAAGAAAFTTKSRAVRHWADVAPAEMPALFQEQGKQRGIKNPPTPTKWVLTADLIIYVSDATPSANGTVDIATLLNNAVDAVDAALAPSPATGTQTLGGLVTDARIVGDVDIYEGRLDAGGRLGVAVIPVEIVASV